MPQIARTLVTLAKLPGGTYHEHTTWIIGPVGVHRDSDSIARSNFAVACARLVTLDPDEVDHEVHRFGHFAVGWVEEIATRPGSPCAKLADEMRASLESYPILDDDHHSEVEAEDVSEAWPSIASGLRRSLTDSVDLLRHEYVDSESWPDLDGVRDHLDSLTDGQLAGLASGLGEASDGWIRYSASDLRGMAEDVVNSEAFASLVEGEGE